VSAILKFLYLYLGSERGLILAPREKSYDRSASIYIRASAAAGHIEFADNGPPTCRLLPRLLVAGKIAHNVSPLAGARQGADRRRIRAE